MTSAPAPYAQAVSTFPDPASRGFVLEPFFDAGVAHHLQDIQRIDRAHLIVLREGDILAADDGRFIARALIRRDESLAPETLAYDGRVEDLFFLLEDRLNGLLPQHLWGALHTGHSRKDLDHTLFRFGLKRRVEATCHVMCGFAEALLELAADAERSARRDLDRPFEIIAGE